MAPSEVVQFWLMLLLLVELPKNMFTVFDKLNLNISVLRLYNQHNETKIYRFNSSHLIIKYLPHDEPGIIALY